MNVRAGRIEAITFSPLASATHAVEGENFCNVNKFSNVLNVFHHEIINTVSMSLSDSIYTSLGKEGRYWPLPVTHTNMPFLTKLSQKQEDGGRLPKSWKQAVRTTQGQVY